MGDEREYTKAELLRCGEAYSYLRVGSQGLDQIEVELAQSSEGKMYNVGLNAIIIDGVRRGVDDFMRIVPQELHNEFEIKPRELLERGQKLLKRMAGST